MREIKFRVWDKVSKKYRKFDGMHDTMMMINKDGEVEYYNLQNGSGGDEYILEQFTGLHDATKWEDLTDAERDEWIKAGHTKEEWKGRRVFEGDIYTAFGNGKYEIRFINGSFCGGLLGGDDSIFAPLGWESLEGDEDLYLSYELFKIMKIIGNIHDNPELQLEGQEQ